MSLATSRGPNQDRNGDQFAQVKVHVLYRDGSGVMHLDWPLEKLDAALQDRAGTVWVDFEGGAEDPDPVVEKVFRDLFHFHPLAIDDALTETHVPKIDDWDDYVFVVFHSSDIHPQSNRLILRELNVFLGPNYLATYHPESLDFLNETREAIERDPRDRMREGADLLLFRLLERAIDQSLLAIEALDERIDDVQDEIIADPRPESLRTIFRLKRAAIHLHKTFGPQREVLNKLSRDPLKVVIPAHRVYFRDLYDHIVRIHDISEGLRDLISGALDTYLSVMSNRTNEIMKTLTMVTVMFLPMTFLTGFFGMNFFSESLDLEYPWPHWVFFLGSILLMTASPVVMLLYARRRGWLEDFTVDRRPDGSKLREKREDAER